MILQQQVFYPPIYQPRRIEPFMAHYAAAPASPGVEYMELFTNSGYASTPWDSGIPLTGNIEIRLDLAPVSWTPATNIIHVFAAHAFQSASNFRWYAGTAQGGELHIQTRSIDGTTRFYQSGVLTWPDPRYQLRFTLNRNNGTDNSVGTWYRRLPTTGLDDNAGWTVVGTELRSWFTDLQNIQAPLVTMANTLSATAVGALGQLHRFMLYDGIGGTVVSDLNFDDAAPAETEVWDDQAALRLWTMQGVKGADWLHSTDQATLTPLAGIIQIEGGVPILDFDPPSLIPNAGTIQIEGGVPVLVRTPTGVEPEPDKVSVEVAGVQHPFFVGSLVISRRVNERSTMAVDIRDLAAAQRFKFNQPIRVLAPDGMTKLFNGWINDISEESLLTVAGVSQGMRHTVGAKDNHYLADKRLVFSDYSSQTAGSVVENIIDTVLVQEGVTKGVIEDGAMLGPSHVIDGETAAQAIQKLADMSRYVWMIDVDRVLHFRPRTSVTAPIVSYGTGMIRGSVRVRRQNLPYRNRQFTVGGVELPVTLQTKTIQFAGDGSTRTFLLPFYPTLVQHVRVNDADQTFKAIDNSTAGPSAPDATAQWFWSPVTRQLIQASAGTTLATGDTLEIQFQTFVIFRTQTFLGDGVTRSHTMASQYHSINTEAATAYVDYGSGYVREHISPMRSDAFVKWTWPSGKTLFRQTGAPTLTAGQKVVVRYTDASKRLTMESERPDEIARNLAIEGGTTSGIVETIEQSDSALTPEEVVADSDANLNRWSHDTVELEYQTWNSQLADGEVAPVDLPDHGINMEDFLIQEIVITDRPTSGALDQKDSPLVYEVRAVRSPEMDAGGGTLNPRRMSDVLRQL